VLAARGTIDAMKLAKPPVPTESLLSLTFDEARSAIVIAHELAPPLSAKLTLAYRLTRDEARSLAEALGAYADTPP
jgi:hypothetical protein